MREGKEGIFENLKLRIFFLRWKQVSCRPMGSEFIVSIFKIKA